MKKITKMFTCALLALSLLTGLTGCTSAYAKQKAFLEYSEGMKEDVVYWEAAQRTSDQMLSPSTSATAYVSYIGTIIGYLDKISENATNRNAAIYDPEIKAIDDNYVECVNKLRDFYSIMQEGISEYDEAKIARSEEEGKAALECMKNYVGQMNDFMEHYNIKSTADMETLLNDLNQLE